MTKEQKEAIDEVCRIFVESLMPLIRRVVEKRLELYKDEIIKNYQEKP